MATSGPDLDCLIIGGGAAGLTGAIYLSRFRRRVMVVDAGHSRLSAIPMSHNYAGFPQGIAGEELRQRLREQALRYGSIIVSGEVRQLQKLPDGRFIAHFGDAILSAKTVLLATGAIDIAPDMAALDAARLAGCLRYCPICDGYEAIDQRVAVLGCGEHGFREAMFIRHFTPHLTLLTMGKKWTLDSAAREQLQQAGIRILNTPGTLTYDADSRTITAHLVDSDAGGTGRIEIDFDILYPALGLVIRSELAQQLGARTDEDGKLLADAHMQSTIDGLYCAGDIAQGLNQIAVATGQAAIAATAIHNRL